MHLNHSNHFILADGRWSGAHGIGRFSAEILTRLQNTDIITNGPKPLSMKNFLWQARHLYKKKNTYKIFFTPGFNPVNYSPIPFILTICDLIYLYTPGKSGLVKKALFEIFVKPSIKKAHKILTISEYSKKTLIEWAKIPAEKIINVSCGISQIFTANGIKHTPDYPYLLHVGNTKAHKNVERLIQAFSFAKIDSSIKLILTGQPTSELHHIIAKNQLQERIVFSNTLSETKLAEYYRGATALVFPSLYEGFGLPVLEAMASGTPVITSNVTSLPEVAGDAAMAVSPYEIDSIVDSIEKIFHHPELRQNMIEKGFQRVKLFSWDNTAIQVQTILNEALAF